MEDIEKLKQKIENRKSLMLYNKELEKEYERDIEAIENLINKNKELEKEVKQHKKYIKRMVRLEQLNYKMIKLMAKDIAENKLDEDICSKVRSPEKEECDCYADMYDACYGCVIEYYEKKAKGE